MILLDTVVLSELRKTRPSPLVVAWLRGCAAEDLFISAISIGEIERGICKVADRAFAEALTIWLEDLLRLYADRVLPITASIARRWGQLSARLGHDGADLLIAATALSHGLTVATRNVRHFVPAGVQVIDPFAGV